MFSTLPTSPHTLFQRTSYAPPVSSPLSSSPLRSSPLSPRDGNIPTRQFFMSSPTPVAERKEIAYSKRVVKPNPLNRNPNEGRETRRSLFFKKVRAGSEDRRWEARGGDDEMMRIIWLAEEKRRVEKRTQEAFNIATNQEEEDEELDKYGRGQPLSTAISKDEEMVDEIAEQEDAEMEALLAMMDMESVRNHSDRQENLDTPYGSDDEEYDSLFMDVIDESEPECRTAETHTEKFQEDSIDTDVDMS